MGDRNRQVAPHGDTRIRNSLGELQHFAGYSQSGGQLSPQHMKGPEPPQGLRNLRRGAQPFTKRARPQVQGADFLRRVPLGRNQRHAEGELQPQFLERAALGVRQCRKQFQSPPRGGDRLLISRPVHGIDASLLKVPHRPLMVARLLEMHRQFRRNLIRAISVYLFAAPSYALVQLHAPRR